MSTQETHHNPSTHHDVDYGELFRSEKEITRELVEDHGVGMMRWINNMMRDKYRRREGLDCYKRMGEAGSVMGCMNAANCFTFGVGTESDVEEGMRWYKKGYELMKSRRGVNDIGRCESNFGIMPEYRFNIGRVDNTETGRGLMIGMMMFNLSNERVNRQALHMFMMGYISGGERFMSDECDCDEICRIKERHFPHIDLLIEAYDKHENQEHNGAFSLYEVVCREGNDIERQISHFNLGNCYMYGVGVAGGAKRDEGFKHWHDGGHIDGNDVEWMEMISNWQFMRQDTVDLHGLFSFEDL